VKDFCYRIFQDLKRLKIKDRKKFVQHLGADYEKWTELLEMDYPKPMIQEILNDDEFWKLTLKVAKA
jgi:hypothetical protein